MMTMWFAAADGSAAFDVTSVFLQYGVLGVVAGLLIWFAKGAHQREKDRSDRLEAEVQRLHELIIDRVIPALSSATTAAQESADLLAATQRERERERELAQLTQRQREGGR